MFASGIPSPFKVHTVSNIVVIRQNVLVMQELWLLLSVVTLRQVNKLIDPR